MVRQRNKDLTDHREMAMRPGLGDRIALYVLAAAAWAGACVASAVIVIHAAAWYALSAPHIPMDTVGPRTSGADWSAEATSALVSGSISDVARGWFAASDAIGLTWVAALAAAGYLFFSVARGARFSGGLTSVAAVTAPLIAIGGLAQSATWFIGIATAREDLRLPDEFVVSTSLPVAQVLIGGALGALALLLKRGQRLQADVDGLV